MHTSITAHICAEYLLDEHKQEWGPNYALFVERLGTTEAKEYLQNLYFTYLFVMRAAVKAAPVLTSFDFNTGTDVYVLVSMSGVRVCRPKSNAQLVYVHVCST